MTISNGRGVREMFYKINEKEKIALRVEFKWKANKQN